MMKGAHLIKGGRDLIALTLLTATVCALAACGQGRGGPPGGGQGGFAFPVAAAPITRGDIADYVSVTSSVDPKLSASLSSVISGTVITVGAQIGQRVHAGQLLVQIDDSTLRAQQSEQAANLALVRANTVGGTTTAQANLNSAKVAYETSALNLRRNETLLKQGYVSQSALDDSRRQAQADLAAYQAAQVTARNASLSSSDTAAVASLQNAEASLAFVERQIAQSQVSAPFDGVVTARNVDPGSLAAPGTVLMEVSQLDPVYVDMGIAGDDLSYVHVGTPVTVTIAGGVGRTWNGKVAYLNQAATPGTLIYTARIPLANPDLTLRAGMVATVQFARSRKSGVLLAPRAAVYQTPAGYSMFIIEDGKAKEVPVEVGIQNDQQAEVSGAGLKPGVQAILNHSALLQPGTPVQVLPPPGAAPPQGAAPPSNGSASPSATKH
jgi:HlyD family secretion protein